MQLKSLLPAAFPRGALFIEFPDYLLQERQAGPEAPVIAVFYTAVCSLYFSGLLMHKIDERI